MPTIHEVSQESKTQGHVVLTVRVPVKNHTDWKVYAAATRTSLQELVMAAVGEYVERNPAKVKKG